MKKSLKILGITLGSLLALILAVMVALPILLNEKLGTIVKTEANKMVEATVDFDRLSLSLFRHFPKASLDLVDFSVVGKGEFEGEKIVAAKRFEVVVDLLSIFGDSFEVSNVVLASPEINARVLPSGKANWDIIPTGEEQCADTEESSEGSSFRLSLSQLLIEDAKLYYTDESSRMHFHVAPLSVALKGDLSAKNTNLQTSIKAEDITFISEETTLAKGITASLRATIGADMESNRYTLVESALSVNDVRASLAGSVTLLEEGMDTDLVLDCSENNFKNILSLIPALFTKDFKNLTASGDVSLTAWVRGLLKGDVYPSFEVKLNVDNGRFKYADLPKAVENIVVAAKVVSPGGKLDSTTVDVSRLGATFGGQTIAATLYAATPMSDMQFKVSANGRVNLGAIKDIYPLDEAVKLDGIVTLNASAAGKMSQIEKEQYDKLQTSGRVGIENIVVNLSSLPSVQVKRALATISPAKAALEECDIMIGKSDIAASGSLSNYWGYLLHNGTLTGSLNLSSKMLDVNELMASLSTDEDVAPSTEEKSESEPMSVIEVPKNLNLLLNSTFENVLFQKMEIGNLRGLISVKNGTLTLDKLAMNLFGGKASAYAKYSTDNVRSPKVALDASFTGASFKTTFAQLELMQKIAPIFESIDGTYSMNVKTDLKLDETMSPVLKSVNGEGKITSGNISLANVKAMSALSSAIGGSKLGTLMTSEPTIISFTIKDGDVITKPFDVRLGKVKLNLSGRTGLDQSINYSVNVTLPEGSTIYGKIGGSFSSPKVTLDAMKTIEQVLNNTGVISGTVSEEVDNALEEAEKAAAKLIEQAKAEKQKLVAKANNPIAKAVADKAGDALIKEAEKQAAKLIEEAKNKTKK